MSSNIRIRRRCQFCDAEFIAQKTVTKYCSLRCAQRAYKKRVKDQKIGIAQTEFIKPELERLKLIANKEVFNTVETCLFLGVSRTTLWRLLKSGCIKYIKVGRLVRIERKNIQRYIDSL
jgi:excisionase family DNA binding protein